MSSYQRIYLSLMDEKATQDLGRVCASVAQTGDVFLLHGDLGMGKSVFSRAFIGGLNPDITDVPSPTFTIVQHYDTPKGRVDHYDLYRLEDEDELHEIGFDESLTRAICLVEWPDRLGAHMPEDALVLALKPHADDKTARRAYIEGKTERLSGLSWPDSVTIENITDI